MVDTNVLIDACREVTRAHNAIFWGRWLTPEPKAEAEDRLRRALEHIVQMVRLPQDEAAHTSAPEISIESWDRWYDTLPSDLKRRLSLHDFKRLGECFKAAIATHTSEPGT